MRKLPAKKEGFDTSTQSKYDALKDRLQTSMAVYCDLASFAQQQMKKIYMSPKMSDDGIPDSSAAQPISTSSPWAPSAPPSNPPRIPRSTPGETEQQANDHIQQTYQDVYACKDDLASSRASCPGLGVFSGLVPNKEKSDVNPGFVSCDNYMNLPASADDVAAVIALGNIPDTLGDRITKEVDWYSTIIRKLTDALQVGSDPPPTAPDTSKSPSTDASGATWSSGPPEGFTDATCSPAAAQAKQELLRRKQLEDQANSCNLPSLDSEIARINGLLDSSIVKAGLASCDTVKDAMQKLISDMKKAAEGTLYDWQKDGPKKKYTAYGPAGDRITGLTNSMKQNQ